ncbi:THAP domain-containing protein 3 isoform X2 [Acipenser oxyrinchus oxyrinchus]|uniref:THAP domain-containing protein 3 isoform X2 n=1 Tax=Acipenser oxyrinchus oxyrinchus TaxID=40147 RepID=A0AAD8CWY9_ACIOX|nr:THAP domain-containing protein 3 isoform X2 [Acipenser oxyrinchus oxyrinchus]
MPKSCSAYNCTNRYNSKNPELTFHRFPLSKPHLLQEWLENIGRADFCPKRHMVICSQHFTPESFSSYGNRKNLTWNAVPTLFNATQGQPKVRRYGKLLKQLKKNDPDPSPVTPATPVAPAGEESRQCSRCQGAEPVKGEQDQSQPPHTQRPLEPVSREHSYALSDLRVMKARFFGALESNAKLRKRLKVKVEIIRRTKLKLKAANHELERLRAANQSAAGAEPVCALSSQVTETQPARRKTCFINEEGL